MNPEEIKIYHHLMNLGVDYETIKLLPEPIIRVQKRTDNRYILETSQERYGMCFSSGGESRLRTEFQILKINQDRGNAGFLYPIELKDKRLYATIDDGRCLYLTIWPELQPITFSDENAIDSLLKLIIDFRQAIENSEFNFIFSQEPQNSLIFDFQEIIRYLKTFTMLATYRLYPTKFDQLFLKHSTRFIEGAEQALVFLLETIYQRKLESKTSSSFIINNFSRSNLRLLPSGQVVCLSLEGCRRDLPFIDMAQVLVKTGRSNHWSRKWFDKIIETYQLTFPLSNEELKIIHAYLAFPWEFYRLASRYYHNKFEWSPQIFVEKLERLLKGEENRLNFLEELNKSKIY